MKYYRVFVGMDVSTLTLTECSVPVMVLFIFCVFAFDLSFVVQVLCRVFKQWYEQLVDLCRFSKCFPEGSLRDDGGFAGWLQKHYLFIFFRNSCKLYRIKFQMRRRTRHRNISISGCYYSCVASIGCGCWPPSRYYYRNCHSFYYCCYNLHDCCYSNWYDGWSGD